MIPFLLSVEEMHLLLDDIADYTKIMKILVNQKNQNYNVNNILPRAASSSRFLRPGRKGTQTNNHYA